MSQEQNNINQTAQDIESDIHLKDDEIASELSLQAVYDIPLKVSAILGYADLKINQILKLNKGSIVELDKKVGSAVDICINDKIVARGEIVLVDDRIGVTLTEIFKSEHSI